jgi:HAE1 family hydrophobic/amphiphilic exporter-1
MRLFDEMNEIKQSQGLMARSRKFYPLLVLVAALSTRAENQPPNNAVTNSPPSIPTAATNYVPPAAAATTANGLPPARKTRVISLTECIQLAIENNLDIQIQRYNPRITEFTLKSDYGAYDPTASFSASKDYNDLPGGLNPQTGVPSPATLTESDNYTPTLKGVLPTGTTYDFTGTLSRQSSQSQFTNFPQIWLPPAWVAGQPGFGVILSQPLLKNFWIDKSRLQIRLDKASLKISEYALQLQVMTTVTAVKSAYFNLLYNRGNVEANATALKLAQQLVSENVRRVQVGTLAKLDEKQSESQAAASQASLQAAQQALVVQENTLKSLLTTNYLEWADTTPVPTEELIAVPQELDLQLSWRKAITQRPELAEAKLNVEKQNVTLKYNHNQLFPELDVFGSYGHNANDPTFDGALTQLGQGNHSFYTYGASVSIPLGNIAARNNYKASKMSLKQILLQLKQQEQTILVQVDNDVGQVRSTLQQVDATRAARIYAEDALAAERTKLENGKSTSFIVLQLISNLTTARVNEIQALANYNIAVNQLALDEGSTLDANHIDFSVK